MFNATVRIASQFIASFSAQPELPIDLCFAIIPAVRNLNACELLRSP
jgi:hypothetical protein